MKKWLRRIRGAIGMGLTWATAWFGAGMIMLLGLLLVTGSTGADVPYPLGFGAFGFVAGVTFSGVLGLVDGRRRFDQMSLPRFAGWGAAGGFRCPRSSSWPWPLPRTRLSCGTWSFWALSSQWPAPARLLVRWPWPEGRRTENCSGPARTWPRWGFPKEKRESCSEAGADISTRVRYAALENSTREQGEQPRTLSADHARLSAESWTCAGPSHAMVSPLRRLRFLGDLRHPRLVAQAGHEGARGVDDQLAGACPLQRLVRQRKLHNLRLAPRAIAVLASGVGCVLPRARLEHVVRVVLLLERIQTLHGLFGEHAPACPSSLAGMALLRYVVTLERSQRVDEVVTPLLGSSPLGVVGIGPAGEGRAPQTSAASAERGRCRVSLANRSIDLHEEQERTTTSMRIRAWCSRS